MKDRGICLDWSIWIFLAFFFQVIVADTVIYCTGTRVGYACANVAALLLNAAAAFYLNKKEKVRIINLYGRWDIVFGIILSVACILSIGFADKSFDTYSYHLYLQENPFTDKIYEDFFPGRTLTSFVYPIADRLFYLFRSIGGYRLGTLPSYLVMAVLFYEIKKFLLYLIPDVNKKFLSLCSAIPVCTFIILQQMGSYYIDNFSIVLLLEFTYIVVKHGKEGFGNKTRLYYLACVAGMATGVKFTNAIFMIGLIFYLIIRNRGDIRRIKWFEYIFLVAVFVLPLFPYCTDAVRQTGNPFFPYYNKIFRSAYFANENWLDRRFGPDNLWQFLAWPVYILFHPDQAYDLQHGVTDFSFALGYVVSIIYFLKGIYQKLKGRGMDGKKWFLSAVILYYYFVWERFALGYTRYAGVIPVLGMVFVIWLLWEGIVQDRKLQKILCVAGISISVLTAAIMYCGYCAPRYYACYFMPSVAKLFEEDNTDVLLKIRQAFTMPGRDRERYTYDIEGIWGVVRGDSLVPQLLSADDRIVHLEYGYQTGETEKSQQIYWDLVLNNPVFVPLYKDTLYKKLGNLDGCHFEVMEITDTLYGVPFLQGEQVVYIVRVEYNGQHNQGNADIFDKLKNASF